MSIRAYKVKEIKLKKEATFNVGENFDWLELICVYSTFNTTGECRTMEFFKDDVENAIKDYKEDDNKVFILKAILYDFERRDNDYIEYSCY